MIHQILTDLILKLHNPYVVVNILFIIIILSIFTYSWFLSPLSFPSNYTLITGNESVSTGLTRSFSEILRFNFYKANEYNVFGLRVFLFFFLQLILRIFSLVSLFGIAHKLKQILIIDILFSGILFLYSFFPFYIRLFTM